MEIGFSSEAIDIVSIKTRVSISLGLLTLDLKSKLNSI